MRTLVCGVLIFGLAGCSHSIQNTDAVRQGVLAYIAKSGLNLEAMDVKVDAVEYNGDKANARISYYLKGTATPAMSMSYRLEQKDRQWVVVGSEGSGGHGMMPAPAAGNPHGAGTPMPSPEDLPPVGKKK